MKKLLTSILLLAAVPAMAQVSPQISLDQTAVAGCRRIAVRDPFKAGSDKTVTLGCMSGGDIKLRGAGMSLATGSTIDIANTPVLALDTDGRPLIKGRKLTRAVEDYAGSDPATAAVNSATRYSEIVFGKQAYTLPNPIYAEGKMLSGSGTVFNGSNVPASISDTLSVAKSGAWRAMYANAAGSTAFGSANENLAFESLIVPPTGAASSYQKNVLYARARTYDPSEYGASPKLRDTVGFQASVEIMPGNMTGRAWGAHSIAYVFTGAEGYAVAHEFELHNFGPAQPLHDTITSKYDIHAVAVGGLVTAAIKGGSRDGGTFQDFIYTDPGILVGNFLNLNNKFAVTKSGAMSLHPAAAATPATNGEMTFELTNDTTVRVKVKGSDGVVRSATLTLAP